MNPELREKAVKTLEGALEHEDWRIRLRAAKIIIDHVESPNDGGDGKVPIWDQIAQRDGEGSRQRGARAFSDAGED